MVAHTPASDTRHRAEGAFLEAGVRVGEPKEKSAAGVQSLNFEDIREHLNLQLKLNEGGARRDGGD